MRTLVDGFREMVHLIADTFRLWWRNLLPMVTWFLAGYVGFTGVRIDGAIWLAEAPALESGRRAVLGRRTAADHRHRSA